MPKKRLLTAWTTFLAVSALFAAICIFPPDVQGQNYTVGDSVGGDNDALLFAPFRFEHDRGEDAYRAYVNDDDADSSGQKYNYRPYEQTQSPGITTPDECTIAEFKSLISDETECLGTLLITTHGNINVLAIEPYTNDSAAAVPAASAAYWAYIRSGYQPDEIGFGRTSSGYYNLSVTDSLIRRYGKLTQGLVYVGSCSGATLNDDFVHANARVSLGNDGSVYPDSQRVRITTLFRRMDGKEGRGRRPVAAARLAPPAQMANVLAQGQESTTLSPAVIGVDAPLSLKVIECDAGEVGDITWANPTTITAVLKRRPPAGVDFCTFTLDWFSVKSASNDSWLDGNTNPEGATNAQGPAHDDYEWSSFIKPCDCDDWTGDLDCSYTLSPIDVVYIVNFVYRNLDARCYPANWNCPLKMGDVNCDPTHAMNSNQTFARDNILIQQWAYYKGMKGSPGRRPGDGVPVSINRL